MPVGKIDPVVNSDAVADKSMEQPPVFIVIFKLTEGVRELFQSQELAA